MATHATFFGKDGPGITAEVLSILAQHQRAILDIGQWVTYGSLSLSVVFEGTAQDGLLGALFHLAQHKHLRFEAHPVTPHGPANNTPSQPALPPTRFVLTVLGHPLQAVALSEVTTLLSQHHINIDTIKKLSKNQFSCLEMSLSTSPSLHHDSLESIRASLLPITHRHPISLGLQNDTIFRRSKRLICFDMDSTLIENEIIDEIATLKGLEKEVAAITEKTMQGEIPFAESLRQRCALLAGISETELRSLFPRIRYTKGAHELIRTLHQLGLQTAVISGGFQLFAEEVQKNLGLDFCFANRLEISGGVLTGQITAPILDAAGKARALMQLAQQELLSLEQVVAVGDGANDLPMLETAGLGIAFNAKPLVREKADFALNQRDLLLILHFLGLSEQDLEHLREVSVSALS